MYAYVSIEKSNPLPIANTTYVLTLFRGVLNSRYQEISNIAKIKPSRNIRHLGILYILRLCQLWLVCDTAVGFGRFALLRSYSKLSAIHFM